ncbi:hypothetical protein M8J77_020565 [Diaphorina citri]|nr:hypothetical protein M8J77_002098 [Diaphorina citri]KAI5715547.1 hypothetical protein M8J77_018070 [Diaphorina citri]KAI5715678.1 hypothetical protein M8J77_020565 [Diaphorina citri]
MEKINNQLKSNPRSFWRFSEETRKVSGFPKEMFLRDSTASTGQETANLFAESFSSAYKKSDLSIPVYPLQDVIDFDVAKAFDRVDSRLLIAKLKSYGVGDSFLRWLSDYLSGRTQQVRLGNSLSSSINVLSGVGQGSHIGPLLFSLFFNDLPDVICHSSVMMFADDVKLYKSITCPEDYLLLQRDLDRFSEWLSLNGMELSLHKCFVMEFSRSKGRMQISSLLKN